MLILKVFLDDTETRYVEVPITPDTTCDDIIECAKEPGLEYCHLVELWKDCERRVSENECPHQILQQWAEQQDEVKFFLRPDIPPLELDEEGRRQRHRNGMRGVDAQSPAMGLPGGGDLSLMELQEMASRQQQQIEHQQQVLVAKEQRLKYLKQQEVKHSHITAENDCLNNLKDRVEAQEMKLKKLRSLRGQVEQFKMSNGSLNSELESIKSLFNEKEKELSLAVAKVEELTQQLEDIHDGKANCPKSDALSTTAAIELDKLRKELVLRNKLNEQQNSKLDVHKEILLQRKDEITKMDKQISELQQRLKKKRAQQNEIQQQTNMAAKVNLKSGNRILSGSNVATVEPYIKLAPMDDFAAFDKQNPKYQSLPSSSVKGNEKNRGGDPHDGANEKSKNFNVPLIVHVEGGNSSQNSGQNVASQPRTQEIDLKNVYNPNTTVRGPLGSMSSSYGNKPLGSVSSFSAARPAATIPAPINIQDEPRTGGSGQSSPATSDGSSPGSNGVQVVSSKNKENDHRHVNVHPTQHTQHPAQPTQHPTQHTQHPTQPPHHPTQTQHPTPQPRPNTAQHAPPHNKPIQHKPATPHPNIQHNQQQKYPQPQKQQPKLPNQQPSKPQPAIASKPQSHRLIHSRSQDSVPHIAPSGGGRTPAGINSAHPGHSVNPSNSAGVLHTMNPSLQAQTVNQTRTKHENIDKTSAKPPDTSSASVNNALSVLMAPNSTSTSPVKRAEPRYASKSVIANTYTRKLGSDALEQYKKNMSMLYKNLETEKQKSGDSKGKTSEQISSDGDSSVPSVKVSGASEQQVLHNGDKLPNKAEPESTSDLGPPIPTSSLTPYSSDKASHYKLNTPRQLRRRHSDSDSGDDVRIAQKNIEQHNLDSDSKLVVKDLNDNTDKAPPLATPEIVPETLLIDNMGYVMEVRNGDHQESVNHEASHHSNHIPSIDDMSPADAGDKKFGPPYSTQVIKRKKPNLRKKSQTTKSTRRVSFDPLALLLDASLEGELDLVITTANEVTNVSTANDEGITALHNAVCAGHYDIVKFLVEFGADVNSPDSDGWTPLHCAASCNNLQMVKLLVENGACIFATNISDNETAAQKCEEDEDGYDGCSEYLYTIQEKLGILNNGVVFAVFEYGAENADELSFKMSDKITILRKGDEKEKEWWWAKLGKEGYVPRNLLGLHQRVAPTGKTGSS